MRGDVIIMSATKVDVGPSGGDDMARLRHIAVCVNDLEKAAKFYESVFELKRVGREDLRSARPST